MLGGVGVHYSRAPTPYTLHPTPGPHTTCLSLGVGLHTQWIVSDIGVQVGLGQEVRVRDRFLEEAGGVLGGVGDERVVILGVQVAQPVSESA